VAEKPVEGPAKTPESSRSENRHFPRPPRQSGSFALTGLFTLATFYTFYFARIVLLPVVLALLFSLLLSPLVGGLRRLHIPHRLGAGLVVLALMGLLGGSVYMLIDPAAAWIDQAPSTLARIEDKVRQFKKPIEKAGQASRKVEELTGMKSEEKPETEVQVEEESLSELFLTGAKKTFAGLIMVVVLLYFLLASGDLFLRKLVRVLPHPEDKKRAVEIARRLRQDISIYLRTITLINIGLGVAEGTAMHLLGMPNPMLWGMMATVFNFVPYLGAMAGIVVIAAVATLSFETPAQYILPPIVYFLLTALEGYFITPVIVGRRLTLNPVVILMGLFLWGWIWGIPGAVLAVPMLASFKIVCDHIPPLTPVGEFLGGDGSRDERIRPS
jgi:predicted PurR-regulated permease PerM